MQVTQIMKGVRKTRLLWCLFKPSCFSEIMGEFDVSEWHEWMFLVKTIGTKSSAFHIPHIHCSLPPQCQDGVHTWGLVNVQEVHGGFLPYLWGCTETGSSFHWGDRVAPVSLPHKFLSSERASADVEIFSALHEGHMTMKVKNKQTRTQRAVNYMVISSYACIEQGQGGDWSHNNEAITPPENAAACG